MLNKLGLLYERGFACQTLRNTSKEVHFPKLLVWRKYEPFFQPLICLLSSSAEFPLNQPVVGLCGCVRKTVWMRLSLWKGGTTGFFWLQAQSRCFVFAWVSDCSRPVEGKHAVTFRVALITVDPWQAISDPRGLRFDSTVLSLCFVFFYPLQFPLSFPLLQGWDWYFTLSCTLS